MPILRAPPRLFAALLFGVLSGLLPGPLPGLWAGAALAGQEGGPDALLTFESAAPASNQVLDLSLGGSAPGYGAGGYGDTDVLLSHPGSPPVDWSRSRREQKQLNPLLFGGPQTDRPRYEDDIPKWQPFGAERGLKF